MATNATTDHLDAIHWLNLEMQVAVGDRWRFDDGETCTVASLDGGTVLCTSGIRYPVAALVRTADKLEAQARRAA